jgi:hypothetical protein
MRKAIAMVSERSARFSANLPGRFRRPSPRVVCPKELRFRKHPWRICFVIASMALFGFVLCAQDKNLTLTSETELVLVPTVINDKFGSHVPGLTKDDFRLKQDGKTFPIAVFEELKTTAPITYSPERNQETFSNFAPGHEENRRLSIVVLDFVNTPPSDQNNARQGLLKFLLDVGDSRESILLLALTREGLVVLHDFCVDPKILAEAVRKIGADTAPLVHETVADAGHPPANDMMAVQIARMISDYPFSPYARLRSSASSTCRRPLPDAHPSGGTGLSVVPNVVCRSACGNLPAPWKYPSARSPRNTRGNP